MQIAISGTHCVGKSTLIEDYIEQYPNFSAQAEAYYLLAADTDIELSHSRSFEFLVEQLQKSIELLTVTANQTDILYDRCPIDYLAYLMVHAEQNDFDLQDTEVAELFPDIISSISNLDMIVFLPLTKEHHIKYTEEDPEYRRAADHAFKKLYREDRYNLFPNYNQPTIIELWGNRAERIKKLYTALETYKN